LPTLGRPTMAMVGSMIGRGVRALQAPTASAKRAPVQFGFN
jgi:hypothetical protein